MKAFRMKSISLDKVINLFWGLVLVSLPVTTFNFFPSMFQSSQNRPLALYPLAILIPLLLYRQLKQKDFKLPTVLIPLLAFLAAAFFSTVWGFQFLPVEVHGQSYLMRTIKGWLSVGIGLGFFYVAFMSVRTRDDLLRSLRWLFAGFLLSAIVGIIQIVSIQMVYLDNDQIHKFLAGFIRQTSHSRRISGLAFEPSWFADQLVILYLPWLLSVVLFDLKLTGKKVLDWLLLLLLGGLLIFTYSRSGILNAGMSVVIALGLTSTFWWQRFKSGIQSFFLSKGNQVLVWIKRIGLIIVVLGILAGVVFAMTQYSYFINIFNFSEQESLIDYLVSISFGPRAGYAVAAFEVFDEHPALGVGWGGSGLHMYGHIPDWLKTFSKEMEHFFDPGYNVVPNPKNMYVRLLAETGLVGFWLFIGFQLSILGQVVRFFRQKDSKYHAIGFAGLLIWLLISIRYLTMDSFASPVPWIGLGIIVGMAHYLKNKEMTKKQRELNGF